MEDLEKNMKLKSFDFASSVSKQLITLSSSIFAFTITFREHIYKDEVVSSIAHDFLTYVWGLFIASIFFGVWTMMALAGSLDRCKKKDNSDMVSIYDFNIVLPAGLQILFFIVALILAICAVR